VIVGAASKAPTTLVTIVNSVFVAFSAKDLIVSSVPPRTATLPAINSADDNLPSLLVSILGAYAQLKSPDTT
jgi:hypothetical protein